VTKTTPKAKAAKKPAGKAKVARVGNTPTLGQYELSEVENTAVEEYMINGGNQSAALRLANPKACDWTDNSVHVAASQLFNQTKVRIRIAQLRAERAQRSAITTDRVLQEAYKLAFADVSLMFNEDGSLKMPHEWPKEIAGAIAGFEVVTMSQGADSPPLYVHKVKFWDKNPALERLFKHMGLFEADNRQKNPLAGDLSNLPAPLLQLIQDKLRESGLQPASGRAGPDDTGNGVRTGNPVRH
jgi:phage terminase small subunit